MHFYRVGPVCVHHVRGNPLAKIRFEAVDAHVQQHCQLVLIPPDRLRIGEIHNGKAGLPHIPLPHVPIRSFQEIPLFCALVKEGGFLPDIGINPDADFDAFFLNPFQHTRRVGKYPLVPDKVRPVKLPHPTAVEMKDRQRNAPFKHAVNKAHHRLFIIIRGKGSGQPQPEGPLRGQRRLPCQIRIANKYILHGRAVNQEVVKAFPFHGKRRSAHLFRPDFKLHLLRMVYKHAVPFT